MKKSKQVVYTTEDYDKFTFIKENRSINKAHVKKLIESMKQKTIFNPILINSKNEIIDGQHRLLALKSLLKEVEFTIVDDVNVDDLISLNTNSKDWRNPEFLEHYVKSEHKEYKVFKYFKDKYKFSIAHVCCIVYEKNVQSYDFFKKGKFRFLNLDKAETFAKRLDQIGKNNPDNKHATRDKQFILALIEIQKSPKFKWRRLLDILKEEEIGQLKNVGSYISRVTRMYNKGLATASQVYV